MLTLDQWEGEHGVYTHVPTGLRVNVYGTDAGFRGNAIKTFDRGVCCVPPRQVRADVLRELYGITESDECVTDLVKRGLLT
jgi:hypothetical protein